MTDLRSKPEEDERYRPIALIRRLLTEQGFVHWRKYAVAFVLMALSAGCTAMSAYLIGDVINQAYVNHNLPGIVILGGITAAAVHGQGSRHLRPQRAAVAHRQPDRRQ